MVNNLFLILMSEYSLALGIEETDIFAKKKDCCEVISETIGIAPAVA